MDRFDKELRDKLNMELRDIRLSEEAIVKLNKQLGREKSLGFKGIIAYLMNYEIKISYSTCIAVAALAVFLGISSFTVTDKDIASFADKNIIEVSGYWEELR